MRSRRTYVFAAVFFAVTAGVALGIEHKSLGPWFYAATAINESPDATSIKTADFLPGKTQHSMRCGQSGVPIGNGIWQLVKYDRTHEIALAMASSDQCSVAVFKAPPPGVDVPDENLSSLSTGRGIRIGSTYQNVLSAYGGKRIPRVGRFVVAYTAGVPTTSIAKRKAISDPETITFVFENQRVSSMSISIDEAGEY